jgi:hypothetical protein
MQDAVKAGLKLIVQGYVVASQPTCARPAMVAMIAVGLYSVAALAMIVALWEFHFLMVL